MVSHHIHIYGFICMQRIIRRLQEGVVGNDLQVVGSIIRLVFIGCYLGFFFSGPINESDDQLENSGSPVMAMENSYICQRFYRTGGKPMVPREFD